MIKNNVQEKGLEKLLVEKQYSLNHNNYMNHQKPEKTVRL